MELYRSLLSRACLSMVSAAPDDGLHDIARIITPSLRIAGPEQLAAALQRLLAASDRAELDEPRTLDLIGHSAVRASQLRLGDWVIDVARPEVAAFFRGLARRGVLPRLGIRSLRLLGCGTASTADGRATICALAEILRLEVYGTTHLLYDVHYDERGFRDAWAFLLVAAGELRRTTAAHAPRAPGPRWPRTLELDALPAQPLGPRCARTRRVATVSAAREILRLIRRDAGAPMPGPAAAPISELALPSETPGAYHVAEVLGDGGFVRFYPDGPAAPGVAYPVDDAPLLCRIVDALPAHQPGMPRAKLNR
jgi:hypothetical protein